MSFMLILSAAIVIGDIVSFKIVLASNVSLMCKDSYTATEMAMLML